MGKQTYGLSPTIKSIYYINLIGLFTPLNILRPRMGIGTFGNTLLSGGGLGFILIGFGTPDSFLLGNIMLYSYILIYKVDDM